MFCAVGLERNMLSFFSLNPSLPGVDRYMWCEGRDLIVFPPLWIASWPSKEAWKIQSILSPLVCNASCAISLCESVLYLHESASRLLILSLSFSCTIFIIITLYNFIILQTFPGYS